ncbi:MAG: hypothetical protein AAF586_03990 [Planctomycetota bacterium]
MAAERPSGAGGGRVGRRFTAALLALLLLLAGLLLMGWGPSDPGERELTQRWRSGTPVYVPRDAAVDAAWWLPRTPGGGVRADEPPAWTLAERGARAVVSRLDRLGVPARGWEPARVVSAWSIGLTWAMVMWIGWSLGGARAGWFAGLVALAVPGLAALGREPHPASLAVVASVSSIAAAMWAIRPMRPAPGVGRQAIGWGLCGLAAGLSVLTAGVVGAWAVAWPIGVAIVLSPGRIGHTLGMIAASLVTALIVLPWALTIAVVDPSLVGRWWSGELAGLSEAGAAWPWRAGMATALEAGGWVALLTLPWTVWVVVSLAQPFSTSSNAARGRLMVAWAGLLGVWLGLLVAPGAVSIRLALALPAMAVLLGMTFDGYVSESEEGRLPRLWRGGAWVHGLLLPAASVGLLAYALIEPWLVQRGVLTEAWLRPLPVWRWWVTGGLLLTLAIIAMVEAWAGRVRRAVLLWVCWVVAGLAGCLPAAAGRTAMVFMYPP